MDKNFFPFCIRQFQVERYKLLSKNTSSIEQYLNLFSFFFLFSSVQSQSEQADNTEINYNVYHDERRALRAELERFRQENAFLRKSIQLNSTKLHADEQEQSIAKTPTFDRSVRTSSVESGYSTTSAAMPNTFFSNSALQIELNEYKERERKRQEQLNLLQKVRERSMKNSFDDLIMFSQQLDATIAQSNEVNEKDNKPCLK